MAHHSTARGSSGSAHAPASTPPPSAASALRDGRSYCQAASALAQPAQPSQPAQPAQPSPPPPADDARAAADDDGYTLVCSRRTRRESALSATTTATAGRQSTVVAPQPPQSASPEPVTTSTPRQSSLSASPDPAATSTPQQSLLQQQGAVSPDQPRGLRARHWHMMFENLQRAVDQLYDTCELDENRWQCEEVMLILDQAHRDFASLISRFEVQASFEHQAAAGSKLPPAVAWEVRKLSSSSSIRRSAAPPAALNTSIISNSIFNPEEVGAQPLVAGAANTSVSSEEGGAVCATAAAAAGPSPDGQSRVGEVLAPEPLLPLYSPSTVDFTAGMSWGDMADALEGRDPGVGAILHNKLSSPARKKPVEEAVRIAEEKQMRAEQHREERLRELARRLQQRNDRQSQIRLRREETEICMKEEIESKQAKATALRQSYLKEVRHKASIEEIKSKEIAFIHRLEESNRKVETRERDQQEQARLEQLSRERRRRLEEKAAKEAAVQQRRAQLEAERQARLREREAKRLDRLKALARRPAHLRKGSTGSSVAASPNTSVVSLPQGGMGTTATAEAPADTAAEMPSAGSTTKASRRKKKKKGGNNVHPESGSAVNGDAEVPTALDASETISTNRLKTLRKRIAAARDDSHAQSLRTAASPRVTKLTDSLLAALTDRPDADLLTRLLHNMLPPTAPSQPAPSSISLSDAAHQCLAVERVFTHYVALPGRVPDGVVLLAAGVVLAYAPLNPLPVILSGCLHSLVKVLAADLQDSHADLTLAEALAAACCAPLDKLLGQPVEQPEQLRRHIRLLSQHIVLSGCVDRLAALCRGSDYLVQLASLRRLFQFVRVLVTWASQDPEPVGTDLFSALFRTEFGGGLVLLGTLLRSRRTETKDSVEPSALALAEVVMPIISFCFLCQPQTASDLLSQEQLRLAFVHSAYHVIYAGSTCSNAQREAAMRPVLWQTLMAVGHFARHHRPANQNILCGGGSTAVLQAILRLPFAFFSDPQCTQYVFAALIAICVNNEECTLLLRKEMAPSLLVEFLQTPDVNGSPQPQQPRVVFSADETSTALAYFKNLV